MRTLLGCDSWPDYLKHSNMKVLPVDTGGQTLVACLGHAQGGCIIRAQFLDEIREAYVNNPDLKNLLVDPSFAKKLVEHQAAWRKARPQKGFRPPCPEPGRLCGGRILPVLLRSAPICQSRYFALVQYHVKLTCA